MCWISGSRLTTRAKLSLNIINALVLSVFNKKECIALADKIAHAKKKTLHMLRWLKTFCTIFQSTFPFQLLLRIALDSDIAKIADSTHGNHYNSMPGKQVSLDFRIGKTSSNVSHNDGRIESSSFLGLHGELKIDLSGHTLNADTYAGNETVSVNTSHVS